MNDEIKSAYNEGWNYCNSFWVNYIKNQPTAYDIDEKAKQLEENFNATDNRDMRLAYHHAIEILKNKEVV